jgi:hypothetical protein
MSLIIIDFSLCLHHHHQHLPNSSEWIFQKTKKYKLSFIPLSYVKFLQGMECLYKISSKLPQKPPKQKKINKKMIYDCDDIQLYTLPLKTFVLSSNKKKCRFFKKKSLNSKWIHWSPQKKTYKRRMVKERRKVVFYEFMNWLNSNIKRSFDQHSQCQK